MSDNKGKVTWEAAVEALRQQPEQETLVRASYYDDPLLAASERYWRSSEWHEVRSWLKGRTGTALDVGAGRGIASYALARDGFTVTAVEPDTSDLVGSGAIRALATEANFQINVVEEFSERLPFLDASFDVVFARAVLHHTSDLVSACREFHRVLKPGGMLIAVREHVLSRHEDLDAFLAAHPLHHLYGGERAFLLDDYLGALRAAGFSVRKSLGSFASAANYSPRSRKEMRDEIVRRARRVPGAAWLLRIVLASELVLALALRILARLDSRPGRLYSFVCDKAP